MTLTTVCTASPLDKLSTQTQTCMGTAHTHRHTQTHAQTHAQTHRQTPTHTHTHYLSLFVSLSLSQSLTLSFSLSLSPLSRLVFLDPGERTRTTLSRTNSPPEEGCPSKSRLTRQERWLDQNEGRTKTNHQRNRLAQRWTRELNHQRKASL